LLVLCASMLTAADTLLTARATKLFTGGFLVVEPRSGVSLASYLVESLTLDVALVLGIWLAALPVLARLDLGRWQRLAAAGLVAVVPPLWFVYIRYELSRFLGGVLDPDLWLDLAGGSRLEWLAQAHSQLIPVALSIAATLVAGVLLVRALRRRGDSSISGALAMPALGVVAGGFLAASLASAGILRVACSHPNAGCETLERKAAGAALLALFERATDFDLDGFGVFKTPVDQAPFDSSRHPFALDVPGDGIDQNGLGGDHPADFVAPKDDFVDAPKFRSKPNVLVVFLEGVRADTLGTELNGRRVTPNLDSLAAEGASSQHAFANSPYTALSRGQLVGGRLVPYEGQTTWIEDFHANGYEVAWISGQDESFGSLESQMLGIYRADFHFDARSDTDRDVSRFGTRGTRLIPWKGVNRRIRLYLEGRRSQKPLFLYVNYGDTHFPYDHELMDDVLGVPRLPAADIRPEDPNGVYATYANAAANVDRAIGELLTVWREKVGGDTAVIVTSDHGEALFEKGMLGHGLALDATQTRVPLVVAGLGGIWPEPFGLSDLRGSLQRSLARHPGEQPRVRFEPVPGRRILQYVTVIGRPRFLCLRGIESGLAYDTTQRGVPNDPSFGPLIWWWESLQLAELRRAGG
jgi:hypothetical protein